MLWLGDLPDHNNECCECGDGALCGLGSSWDIPTGGKLDWLFEGKAGFEQWREGIAVWEQEPQQKQKVQEVDSQTGADCPGLEAVGRSHGERVLEESFWCRQAL